MKCSKCGAEYDNSLPFCADCGAKNPYVEQPPAQTQEQPSVSSKESQMSKRKAIPLVKFIPGLFVLVIGVFLLGFGLIISSGNATSKVSTKGDMASELAAAKSTNETNATGSDSAIQQQVANGWYTNDLLNILNNATASSNNKLMLSVYISAALLLVALGGYLMLAKLLEKE